MIGSSRLRWLHLIGVHFLLCTVGFSFSVFGSLPEPGHPDLELPRAMLRYRLAVYQVFQHNRTAYDQHIRLAERIAPPSHLNRDDSALELTVWFHTATEALLDFGSAARMPRLPIWSQPATPKSKLRNATSGSTDRLPVQGNPPTAHTIVPQEIHVPRNSLPHHDQRSLLRDHGWRGEVGAGLNGHEDQGTLGTSGEPSDSATLIPASRAVGISEILNTADLFARVLGYNETLRSIESRVDSLDADDAERWGNLVSDLEELQAQRAVSEMYLKLLPEDARQITHRSTEVVLSLIAKQFVRVKGNRHRMAPAQRDAFLQLGNRLKQIAANAGSSP